MDESRYQSLFEYLDKNIFPRDATANAIKDLRRASKKFFLKGMIHENFKSVFNIIFQG